MRGIRPRSLLLLIACALGVAVVPLLGQSPPDQKRFQVATIKPNKSTDGRGVFLQPGGRFTAIGIRLRDLIRIAYGEQTLVLAAQIVGGPDWLGADRFDIVAKADADFGLPPPEEGLPKDLLAMLRTLIEDRCTAKVHLETRDLPIYNLVAARSDKQLGPQLHRSAGDCIRPNTASSPDPSRLCGSMMNNLKGVVSATAVSMQSWVRMLTTFPVVGRVVRDKTGLSGEFDLHMEFVGAFLQNPNPDGLPVPNPAADSGPNLFTALQEQLGLKLEASKGPVDILVIDHIEKPTPD